MTIAPPGLLPEEIYLAVEFPVPGEALLGEVAVTLAALHTPGVPGSVQHVEEESVQDGPRTPGAVHHHGVGVPVSHAPRRLGLLGWRKGTGREGGNGEDSVSRAESGVNAPCVLSSGATCWHPDIRGHSDQSVHDTLSPLTGDAYKCRSLFPFGYIL